MSRVSDVAEVGRLKRLTRAHRVSAYAAIVFVLVFAVSHGADAATSDAGENVAPASAAAIARVVDAALIGDADAQVVSGVNNAQSNIAAMTSAQSMTPAASGAYQGIVSRHEAAATMAGEHGVVWDRATTSVVISGERQARRRAVSLVATATETFHIKGTTAPAPFDESIVQQTYLVKMRLSRSNAWQVAQIEEQPEPAQGGGAENALAMPLASEADASGITAVAAGRPSVSKVGSAHDAVAKLTTTRRAKAHESSYAYNPEAAIAYAWRWHEGRNPAYPAYGNDCQNFVSQILEAGGTPRSVRYDWYPGQTPWYNTDYFTYYYAWPQHGVNFQFLTAIPPLKKGDVAEFGWHSSNEPKHAMAVDYVSQGTPMMAGHTENRWNVSIYWVMSTQAPTVVWPIHPL